MTLSSWAKLTAVAALVATTGFAGDQFSVETITHPAQYVFKHGEKILMRYRFAPDTYKSYVADLHTTRGDNVLRDAPFDHLHHHALMYGIVVNGVNFWEEMPGAGVQKCVSISHPKTTETGEGRAETSFTQVLHWLPASDAFLPNTNSRPLLIEERTIRLTVDPEASEVAVHWKARFTVGSRTNTVVLTGANYHGLGLRFQQELDPVATHFYPDGKPDLGGNKQDHSVHPWEAVTFEKEGRPSTIAVFGHPKNKRGEPVFFSMRTPFAYLAATQALDREPLVYKQGDTFELEYLVALYPEAKTEQELSARARKWESTRQ